MKTFKMIVLAVIAFSVVGCATTEHKEGDCITYSEGVCLLTYHNGANTPSGDIDMRFTGLKVIASDTTRDNNGNYHTTNEIGGSVSVKTHQWKLAK